MMLDILKGAAVAVYAVALATLAGWLRGPMFDAVTVFGAAMLAVHLIEIPLVLHHLRRHRGSFAASIALTLLFGLLHWAPLKRAAVANGSESKSWVS